MCIPRNRLIYTPYMYTPRYISGIILLRTFYLKSQSLVIFVHSQLTTLIHKRFFITATTAVVMMTVYFFAYV